MANLQALRRRIASVKNTQQITKAMKVEALQSALTFATQRYQGGRASYLDLLTAQRNLFSAELSLADTRRVQLSSMIQLYKALGGGWLPGGPPSTALGGPVTGQPVSRQ